MNNLKLLRLKYKISLRKLLLNLLLFTLYPTNKFIIALSQNLDKHIVLYQKELFMQHSLKTFNVVMSDNTPVFDYYI